MHVPQWWSFRQQLLVFTESRVSNRADAEDIVQDVLLRAHIHQDGVRDKQRLSAWLYRITRHAIIDHYRQSAKDTPEPDLPLLPKTNDDAQEELATCIKPFISTLDPLYRDALTLTELEGYTQQEAAQRLGVPLSTMKSRVQRGRQKLRQQVEACCKIATDRRGKIQNYEVRDPCLCTKDR